MRTFISNIKAVTLTAIVLSCLALPACTTSFKQHLVDLRNAQADSALENQNIAEAEKEYALALSLAPNDAHARAGEARALFLHAQQNMAVGKIDDAYVEVQKALKYAPKDAALLDLAATIDQATIRRDIVVANFPTYKAIGDAIESLLAANAAANKDIEQQVHAFHTDYDATHLRKAIAMSYDLEDEQHRVTQRLIAYRAQIEAGAPGETRAPAQGETPGLLPIP